VKAVIMAGGEGQRLRPLTCSVPKPMVPMLNRPVMEYSVDLLKKHGIYHIATTLQYLPDVIMDHFKDGEESGVTMRHYIEQTPLGTAGSVKNAQEFLDERFVVLSGDAITDIDLSEAVAFHQKRGALATIVLKQVDIPLEYGLVMTDQQGRIERFLEKPGWGEVFCDYANTGIYILEPEVLDGIQQGVKTDFAKDVFPALLENNSPLYAYVADGYWCDIGSIDQYLSCQWDILDGKCDVSLHASLQNGVYVEQGVNTAGVSIQPPCYIAHGAHLEPGAKIGEYSVIGRNAKVLCGADIKRSVLYDQSIVAQGAMLRGAVLCEGAEADRGSMLYEGAVAGAYSVIGEKAQLMPRVRVWPQKLIEGGAVLRDNVIWGAHKKRILITAGRMSGRIGMDWTAEFACALGCALGAVAPDTIALAHDGDTGSAMLYHALCAGILSTGANAYRFEDSILPALKLGIRAFKAQKGVYIRYKPENALHEIEFLDEHALSSSRRIEKTIEDAFDRRTYQFAEHPGKTLHNRSLTPHYVETASLIAGKAEGRSIVLGASCPNTKKAANSLFDRMGCKVWLVDAQKDIPFKVRATESSLGIWLHTDELCLYDETGAQVEPTHVRMLPMLLQMDFSTQDVVMPVGMPDELYERFKKRGAVKMEKACGDLWLKAYYEGTEQNMQSQDLLCMLHTDPLFLCACLFNVLSARNTGVRSLLQDMQGIHMSSEPVACSCKDIGKIMRSFYEHTHADKDMPEGVKISHEQGWAALLPQSESNGMRLVTQGMSEEYAQELADFYQHRIRQIRQDSSPC
jgi:mannose-1-phosphate guanylyltransferase/phosphomannomutase